MQKPISKRDAYIKELRRIADYATELAGNKGVADNIFNDIGEAVCFMCSQPGAEAYACVHGELVAKGRIEQAKELDRFRAKTIKAYEDLINQGPPASYWVGPNGHPANHENVPVRRGKIGGRGYKVITENSKDYKRKCQALAVALNDEANFISLMSNLDGTAEDAFFGLFEDYVSAGYLKKESFGHAVEMAGKDPRLAGLYNRFKNAAYLTFHMSYKRWRERRS